MNTQMNIQELHPTDKTVSAVPFFNGEEGKVTALHISATQQLKEHVTKVSALLICIDGFVVFENEKGIKETLGTGDYVKIEPMVKHWLNAVKDSNLLLIK